MRADLRFQYTRTTEEALRLSKKPYRRLTAILSFSSLAHLPTASESDLNMSNPPEQEIVAIYSSLSPSKRRLALNEMMRLLLPKTFRPRYHPPHVDFTEHTEYRRYAAFELDALWNAQSVGFMTELLPLMYPYFAQLEGKTSIRCLDVGTRTGAGAALMADLFQSHFAMLRIEVDTIDNDDSFREYQLARWPHLRQALVGDVFNLPDDSYDIVVCSHTIEHIEDPIPFAQKLSRIARHFAFFYCPYAETDPIPGHYRVDDSLLDRLQPLEKRVIRSWWWRTRLDPGMQNCVFFVLSGGNTKQ